MKPHYQVWYREYPGLLVEYPWIPSHRHPKLEWAREWAKHIQATFPFGEVEIREC